MLIPTRPYSPARAALARVRRYLILPVLAALVSAIQQYTSMGTLRIEWNVVALIVITAGLGGLSKWIRDEIDVDVKVV